MKYFENFELKEYNTFGINAIAKKAFIAYRTKDIINFLVNEFSGENFLILGGGSNMLFVNDVINTVLIIESDGIEKTEIGDKVMIKVMAGESWEAFVDYCVENNFSGAENLALIPGKVGACPIQNIGAYGTEVKDIIQSVEAVEIESGLLRTFSKEECGFAYRSSVFKTVLKGKYIITAVSFILNKEFTPNLTYSVLADAVKEIESPSIKQISDAVKEIRRSKLPDTKELGNAGSFFKNPVISESHYQLIKKVYPDLPAHQSEGGIKLAAAWLIDKAGFKGKSIGEAGVHDKQALVLVNRGMATGKDILNISTQIQKEVLKKFGVALEPEVNIIE